MKHLGPGFFNFFKVWKCRYLKHLSLSPDTLLPSFQVNTQLSEMDGDVVHRIQERTRQAEDLVKNLKNDLLMCRNSILENCISEETKKILKENERLKSELEYWKTRLVEAEIKNNIKQISLPSDFENAMVKHAQIIHVVKEESSKTSKSNDINIQNEKQTTTDDQRNDKIDKEPKKRNKNASKQEKPAKSSKTGDISVDDSKEIDVSRLDLRIGCILSVKKHPEAENLYIEEIELGEEKPRTVVSGLVKFVPLEEMQNRLVVVLCNLKPAKMRGVLSEAMVMCASTPKKVEVLIPPEGSVAGDRVICEGFAGEPDAVLNPKKKIFELVAEHLKTNEDCIAAYQKSPLMVQGRGFVKAASLSDTQIR